jgi:hypothetical protein
MYDFKPDPFLIFTKCNISMWLAMTQRLWLHNIPAQPGKNTTHTDSTTRNNSTRSRATPQHVEGKKNETHKNCREHNIDKK